MSQKSNKVKKLYQKYKVAGGDSGEEDDWSRQGGGRGEAKEGVIFI